MLGSSNLSLGEAPVRGGALAVGAAPAGEHTVASRAVDRDGNVQPAADDPIVADELTYWESSGQVTRQTQIA